MSFGSKMALIEKLLTNLKEITCYYLLLRYFLWLFSSEANSVFYQDKKTIVIINILKVDYEFI